MKTVPVYLLSFLLFLGVTQTSFAQDEARTQAVELFNEAQELAGSNQFQSAIDKYRETLQVSRSNNITDIQERVEDLLPRVYATRAASAFRDFQSQRTMSSLNTAIDYFKSSQEAAQEFNNQQIAQQAANAVPQLYYQRSIMHFRQSNYSDAMSDLDSALELNANYAVAYYQKGIVQKQIAPNDVDAFMYWYDMAIDVAERVNDNRTLSNAKSSARDELIFRAVNLSEQRRFNDAVELLNRVSDYDPAAYETYYRLSEIGNLRGNWGNAESSARRALELHTGGVADKAKIYFELGTALKGQGNFPAACSAFENARYGSFTNPANHELQFELRCEGHTASNR
ncbi:MAG: hypothetical protein EA360_09590 [Balneolaceae bacterium]|nr:MAG: hypothetical protein EA360_09590 [Balneolaceae bacterium]